MSHNAIIAQAVSGVRWLGHETPVTIQDLFHTGSNAKAMTATLCAVMGYKELLRRQTTPLDVFPDLENNILPGYKGVMFEMLLTHTAGIPPHMDNEADDYVIPDFDGFLVEQQIAHFSKWLLQNRSPVNTPGTEFSYSNAGYSIASAMVEAVTGKSWKENLEEHLFAPLEMEAKVASGWLALHDPNQPWGHWVKNGKIMPHTPDDEYQFEIFLAPAGEVCISLPGYGKFLQMHLRVYKIWRPSFPMN